MNRLLRGCYECKLLDVFSLYPVFDGVRLDFPSDAIFVWRTHRHLINALSSLA